MKKLMRNTEKINSAHIPLWMQKLSERIWPLQRQPMSHPMYREKAHEKVVNERAPKGRLPGTNPV